MVTKLLLVLPVALTIHPVVFELVGLVARARFGSKHFGINLTPFLYTDHGQFCIILESGNKFGV